MALSCCHHEAVWCFTPLCLQFLGLLQQGIIRDVLFLFNPTSSVFHSLVALGVDVCGHPCTVHGGFTSAVIDETTGEQNSHHLQ